MRNLSSSMLWSHHTRPHTRSEYFTGDDGRRYYKNSWGELYVQSRTGSFVKHRPNAERPRETYILNRYARASSHARAASPAPAAQRAAKAAARNVVFDKKLGKYVWAS